MTSGSGNDTLELPTGREQLCDKTVAFALRIVQSSGLPARLEAECRAATGRRRGLPVKALLVGLLCLAIEDRPLHLSGVAELLWRRISPAARELLGVRNTAGTRRELRARSRCVRYLFHAILMKRDPSGLKKNRRLTKAELDRASTTLEPEELARRRRALEALCNELIEASLSLVNDREWAAWSGAIGLDATPVPLWSRGPSKSSGLEASDPDGGWYVREGDHRGEEDHRGRVRGKVAWALEAEIATMAPPPSDPAAHPNMALGVLLDRPGVDPGGSGARLLASVAARGHKTGEVGADRAYSSALASVFHLPVRALGYALVLDYRKDELGLQANAKGAILVEGAWYCPAMPADLVDATLDHRSKAIDDETYRARLGARADYRLYRKDGPDADGYERFSCPASIARPKLSCALRPGSELPRNGRLKVLRPPAEPPRLCTQGSITIAPDVGAKHRQHHVFGSEAWQRAYATCRNTIEGKNGFLKDPAHECLAQPARRRVRGIAAQSLLVAFLSWPQTCGPFVPIASSSRTADARPRQHGRAGGASASATSLRRAERLGGESRPAPGKGGAATHAKPLSRRPAALWAR